MPNDTGLICLDANKKEVTIKQVTDAIQALSFLADLVTRDRLDASAAKTVLTLTEHGLASLSRLTGVPTDTAAERDERYAKLREANTRVRELEKKLGESASIEHAQMCLRNLGNKLDSWWDLEGFGHIADLQFTKGGHCEVTFSCMLFGHFRGTGSATPVTDRMNKTQWLASLRERGFDLLSTSDHDNELLDSENTRRVLCALFQERLPSAQITQFVSHGNQNCVFTLDSVKVFIRSLDEINALPQLP